MSDISEKIALLTDAEVHKVLNRVIEGYAARNPNFPVSDVGALSNILTQVSAKEGETVSPREDARMSDLAAAERTILLELSKDPSQLQFVEGAIKADRAVLVEPITTALVIAGIILVLETKFEISVTRKSGKAEFEVKLGKKPTDKSILKKFFSLFS